MPMRTVVPVCRRRLVERRRRKRQWGGCPRLPAAGVGASILGAWSDGARSCGSTSTRRQHSGWNRMEIAYKPSRAKRASRDH